MYAACISADVHPVRFFRQQFNLSRVLCQPFSDEPKAESMDPVDLVLL